jgi:riboflavin synthase
MFTGIVTAVGKIARASPTADGLRLRIDAPTLGLDDVQVGDSIAIQGICHTVVAKESAAFEVETSAATLAVTTGLTHGAEVNLEKSLRLSDRLGGHLVSGHVDGVGTLLELEELGGSARVRIEAPVSLAKYIARKGSITIDGVSLTVNAVEGACFDVNLIPHTRAVTTLGHVAPGSKVNLEIDLIARYVERVLGNDSA